MQDNKWTWTIKHIRFNIIYIGNTRIKMGAST